MTDPLRFRTRPSRGTPLVSIVIPCFNDGGYLRHALASVADQDYAAIETIVIDDASSDADTQALIAELERGDDVRTIRQSSNGGPSLARNAGIDVSSGRYVLPLDSDNLLLPGAVSALVGQLQGAGERVGFLYQTLQYFGSREDLFVPPEYDLWQLLHANYCDTCALIDRDVFAAGFRYADMREGHEDWDFVLQLAARDIRGQRAAGSHLLYRKGGFRRSDFVEFSRRPFAQVVEQRHGHFFTRDRRGTAAAVAIKTETAPAMSIAIGAVLDDAGVRDRLIELAKAQTCADFELLIPSRFDLPPSGAPRLRRLPAGSADLDEGTLGAAATAARGSHVALTTGSGTNLLSDRSWVEKLLRTFESRQNESPIIMLADAGPPTRDSDGARFPFHLLHADEHEHLEPHTVALARGWERAYITHPAQVVEAIRQRGAGALPPLQWRHMPADDARPAPPPRGLPPDALWRRPRSRGEHEATRRRALAPAAIAGLKPGTMRRWGGLPSQMAAAADGALAATLRRRRRAAGRQRRADPTAASRLSHRAGSGLPAAGGPTGRHPADRARRRARLRH